MIARGFCHPLFICALTLTSILHTQEAVAADSKGQFGVRGVGLISCAIYEKEREARSEVYLITAGWIDGYITGTNQHSSETYDLLSFETTELLTVILAKHCKKNPADTIFPVLKNLFVKLNQDRLQFQSKKTEVIVGERKTSLYVEVVKRIQTKLASSGFYKGKVDGNYEQSSIDAMKAFQRSVQFNPTGFPDQATLWRLLRSHD